MQPNQIPAALRPVQAAQYLGIGASTIWHRAKTEAETGFPQPRKLGPRTTIWLRADLDAYLAACASKQGA